jgi:hypothetical protein
LINRSGKILIVAIKEAAPVAVKEVAPVASLAAPAAPSDTAHVSLPPAPTLPATIAPAVPAVVRARALPAIAPAIRAAMAPTIPTAMAPTIPTAIAPAIPAAIAPAIPAAVTPMVGPAIAPGGSRPTAVIVGATAVCLAAVGLVLNANFASSLGQTGLAAALLAAIGLAVDLLAVALPTAASRLWHARHRAAAFAAGLIWVCALAMMLLAGIGFASVNIGDTVAARAKVANEGVALTARFERLRDERVAIAEQRSIAALEAELQRVQPSAQSVWKATNGCRDVTLARSSKACDGVLRLREAIGAAQQRDAAEAEMRVVEGQLALLPAIRQGDPQAQTTSDLVAWLSNGLVAPSAQDIHRLRVVGLTLAPACAGLLFWMAVALWRRPERDERVRAV